MSSLRIIKGRIKSIHNIHEITKAMEMIAAVRFKRVEGRYRKSLPYIRGLEELISRIVSEELVREHPLFEKREAGKELLVVITGDRGLCGSFNTNILRQAEIYIKENRDREIWVYPVGKVGTGYARRRGWRVEASLVDVGYKFTTDFLKPATEHLLSAFLSKKFDRVSILSSSLAKSGVSKPVLEPYLGLSFLLEERSATAPEADYIFEPDRKATLETLVDLFVRQRLFMILLRSVAAEYNARMIAMKLATDNGKELLKELTLERNKVRQAMITKEISEIIGGVNALS